VEGVVEVMLDATRKATEPITERRLCGWHAALFPIGYSGTRPIAVGTWRLIEAGPMQFVSGPIGRERIHFAAPSADRLPREMARFIEWCNDGPVADPALRAAVAHLWFVTIHPFEVGSPAARPTPRSATSVTSWPVACSPETRPAAEARATALPESPLLRSPLFACGNGGNAANASHFATDLGKGASAVTPRPFRVLSLTDNTPWLTAIGSDFAYEDVFVRQLENHAESGDVLLVSSVSGGSPNLVAAVRWAREHGLVTMALTGAKRGAVADLVDHLLVVPDTHYGRVEDAQMSVLHMICYAIIEGVSPVSTNQLP
jgi:D-sedoheptulose 7-phosphate isomerase